MLIDKPLCTISELNNSIKGILETNEQLKYIYVKGEISNIKFQNNGHIYFSLKDEQSMISAMMFASFASKLLFVPENGSEVIVYASISVYPPRGSYSLNVYEMEPVGLGQQYVELEKLKKQLAKEGLFDPSRKREINIFPKAVGVITAPNGAAIKDIVSNLKRRYPIADIYVFPSSVQGENAPKELLNAFLSAQKYDLDTLIIGRGGGASEDLSAFNDEALVRAVANSRMPVISAVGHEIDVTLVDYAADKRASTPTGAAEFATVDSREILQTLTYAHERMINAIKDNLIKIKEDIETNKTYLRKSLKNLINTYMLRLNGQKEKLVALNPHNVLERGYSITLNKEGKTITDASNIKDGEEITTILNKGKLISKVEGR